MVGVVATASEVGRAVIVVGLLGLVMNMADAHPDVLVLCKLSRLKRTRTYTVYS